MREIDDIKSMIGPIMRKLPLIIPILIFVGIFTSKLMNYSLPMYDAEMKMRLDNMSNSFTNNNLYKDFDVLTSSDKVLTEVEVIKSNLIIYKALEAMAIPVSYYRIGSMVTTEIYPEAPFVVLEDSARKVKRDFKYHIELVEINGEIIIETFTDKDTHQVELGKPFFLDGGEVVINLNNDWLVAHGIEEVPGDYEFCFNSLRGLKANFVSENLLVKAVDKDIDVIKIIFSCANAQKATDFVNKMGQSYVSDYLMSKSKAATLTSKFIETRIINVRKDLVDSEEKLEAYRVKRQVLDTEQELDIGLKKVSQMDQQLANLELKKITMDSLMQYVEKESDAVQKYAPSFEAYGGLLFVELMKKYQSLLGDRRVLLNSYTEESEEVKNVNFKIEQTKSYIQQSIINHKKLVDYQFKSLKERVKLERNKFNDLPVKQRNFLVLQREFQHLEGMYNFLTRKKMEADIAKTANLTFHKVIQEAEVPKKASSPNVRFTILVSVFGFFLILVLLVYMINYFGSTINSKSKAENILEEKINLVMSHDYSLGRNHNARSVGNEIFKNLETNKIIGIASCIGQEGKTFFIQNILEGLNQNEVHVKVFSSVLTGNDKISVGDEEELAKFKVSEGYREVILSKFDLVLIEMETIQSSNNSVSLFPILNHIYFINRFEYTKWSHLIFLNEFIKTYKVSNYSIVLNSYSPFSNYMGFISSENQYSGETKTLLEKFRFCKEWYKSIWIS